MKLLLPILPTEELREADLTLMRKYCSEEVRMQGFHLKNVVCEEEEFSHMIFSGVRFENCRFWKCSFHAAEFSNVEFVNCDISGCDFSNCYINRFAFLSGKGAGVKFCSSVMKNLLIKESTMNYSNFDSARLENVQFLQTSFDSGNMTQCQCKHVSWKEDSLVNVSFFKTSLRGMDFSDSILRELVLSDDHHELQGAIVDLYQAADLARRLGLLIKD
ncbi:pentapeptide repeat-containing protein [Roseburia hominis]